MQSWNAIVITDADLASGCPVQFANPAFCNMTGYTLDELQGRSLKRLQGPDTDPTVIDRLRVCLREARFFEGSTTNYRKDGSSYIVRWNISPVRDENGVLTHFISIQQDISDYVQVERESRLRARALDAAGDAIVIADADKNILFVNRAFSNNTGYTLEEVKGKKPTLFRTGEENDALYENQRQTLARGHDFHTTFIHRRRDGSLYHADTIISPIIGEKGEITHYVSVSKDISEQVSMEQALRQAAHIDKLTSLYNRHHGERLLNESFLKAQKLASPLTLIMCDIDHFKRVNDHFGHPAGDRVLIAVAKMLQKAVRSRDAVIRWGGEEFVIMFDDCAQASAIERAEGIRCQVEEYRDSTVGKVTLSLGLATITPGETLEELIARADAALYVAKHDGRNQLSVAPNEKPTYQQPSA
jgi:diguanylate cyclase (GGDEF)-like protein/PAS domain S-box-containing protein